VTKLKKGDPHHYYLAFDLGASNSRALLGTLNGDVMSLQEIHRFATPIIEREDHLFWDANAIWEELQMALQMTLEVAPHLSSLSVDSWGIDYVPLATDGKAVRNPHCYRDPRTKGMKELAFKTLPAERIYEITGIQFLPFNTIYQLLSDQKELNSTQTRPACHLTIADYFNYLFSARVAIEVSMASTTQLMDVNTQKWSAPLMSAFGLDPTGWPEIIPSGTRLGTARGTNVAVIATCSHDTGSAVAATPVSAPQESWAYISCGTWSLLGVENQEPILSSAARDAGFTNEAGIDGTVRFLKNLTGLWVLQECARDWEKEGPVDWNELVKEANQASLDAGWVDLDDSRFLARGSMESRLQEYCRERGFSIPQSRGQLVRLILVSIARSYRRALSDLERVTRSKIETIYIFGGGSQNSLLCQLTADRVGKTVVAGPVEATAMGNLLIQARTLGHLPAGLSIRDVSARSSQLQRFLPRSQD
jgi:rhamnulokinase